MCMCGHANLAHYPREPLWNFSDCRTWTGREHCRCQEFKLDNLSYIEQEAKRRGLV